jgi:putative Mg2+ transporter-C (MgtC) family protein
MQWLTQSLRSELPAPWLEIVLTLASVICGGIIGTERERHDKPAGVRTLILVCLGSTVFTLASYAFTTSTGDSGRVAAQIVTGIGFLGAGAILHSRTSVTGMTTAASVWVTAAIGITVGVGFPLYGVGLSLLVRVILEGVRHWEIRHLGGMRSLSVEIVFDPDHGKTRIRLEQLRDEFHATQSGIGYANVEGGQVCARLDVFLPRRNLHEFLGAVAAIPEVREIREGPVEGKPPASAVVKASNT